MQNDKKQTIIISILVLILIITLIQNNILRKDMQAISSSLESLQWQVNSQNAYFNHSISSTIQSILNENANRISDYSFTMKSIDPQKNTAIFSLDFEAKSISANANVFVLYKSGDNNWEEVKAHDNGSLSYNTLLELSLKENYAFRFIEKTDQGGMSDLFTTPVQKHLYDEFYVYRTTMPDLGWTENHERFEFSFSLQNNTFGLNELGVRTVWYKMYYQDVLLYDKDITTMNRGNHQAMTEYRIAQASGSTVSSVASQKTVSIDSYETNDDHIESMYFLIELDKSELKEKHGVVPDDKNGLLIHNLHYFTHEMIITYNNGEKITIER